MIRDDFMGQASRITDHESDGLKFWENLKFGTPLIGGWGGPRQIQPQQPLQNVVIAEMLRPAVGGQNGAVEGGYFLELEFGPFM